VLSHFAAESAVDSSESYDGESSARAGPGHESRDLDRGTEPTSHGEFPDAVRRHYAQPDLTEKILAAMQQSGVDIEALTTADLEAVDEFHIGGRPATRRLADLAALTAGMRVLDFGCGIGGPARTLASEYGCQVTGVDIVPEYVDAARELSQRVGLADRVSFRLLDAGGLAELSSGYDVVWLQHVLPNVPAKPELFAQLRDLTIPSGRIAVYEVCRGPGGRPHHPLPWACDESISHLISPDGLRQRLTMAGFVEQEWHDVTRDALGWFNEAIAARRSRPKSATPSPSLGLLMGPDAADKSRNMVKSIAESRILVTMSVAQAR
jgi:2-polyprenyl-3-methyl-5-hydroxy-6-metoxy-1,4-benzoquinol methylase